MFAPMVACYFGRRQMASIDALFVMNEGAEDEQRRETNPEKATNIFPHRTLTTTSLCNKENS